jgi:hypothetical protein
LCIDLYQGHHPLWALSPACKKVVEQELTMRHYQPHVFIDEFQAYLVETPCEFGKKWSNELSPCHALLKKALPLFNLTSSI